jgi:uncharacterized surface protein with fasciclin (FAS1) repeats
MPKTTRNLLQSYMPEMAVKAAAKPAAKAPATIAAAAAGAKDLSILLAAVKESSLLKAATDPATAVTVFAPTNKVRAGDSP